MYNNKSRIFNLNPSLLSSLIWVLVFVTGSSRTNFLSIVVLFFILKYEDRSSLVRNHAGQALITVMTATILNFLLSLIVNLVVFIVSWIPIINIATFTLSQIIFFIFSLLIFSYTLLGFVKAIKSETVYVPIIGYLGDRLTQHLRP